MPKLAAGLAKRVETAEAQHSSGGDFELLTPGVYLAQLREVTVREKPNKHGAAIWSTEYHNLHNLETGQKYPGRQWYDFTLPLPQDKPTTVYLNEGGTPEKWEKYQIRLQGLLKGFFESFGYSVDSDTDELLGEWALITVKIGTIQSGVNQGKQRNEVTGIEALPEDFDFEEFGITQAGDDEAF